MFILYYCPILLPYEHFSLANWQSNYEMWHVGRIKCQQIMIELQEVQGKQLEQGGANLKALFAAILEADSNVRLQAESALQQVINNSRFPEMISEFIIHEPNKSLRLCASVMLKQYRGESSVDTTLEILRCYLKEPELIVTENLKQTLAHFCRKNIRPSDCANITRIVLERQSQANVINQTKAYALVYELVKQFAKNSSNYRSASPLVLIFREIDRILRKELHTLNDKCLIYASKIWKRVLSANKMLHLCPYDILQSIKCVKKSAISPESKVKCLKKWYQYILLLLGSGYSNVQGLYQLFHYTVASMKSKQALPEQLLIPMIEVFKRIYSKLKKSAESEATVETSMFLASSTDYVQKLVHWLANVLETTDMNNDQLRIVVSNALRVFWVHMDSDQVTKLFEQHFSILGLPTADQKIIRNKISIYFLMSSCLGLLKNQIDYDSLVLKVICSSELAFTDIQTFPPAALVISMLTLANRYLAQTSSFNSEAVSIVYTAIVRVLTNVKSQRVLEICSKTLICLTKFVDQGIEHIGQLIVDIIFELRDHNILLECLEQVEAIPNLQWETKKLGKPTAERILEKIALSWEAVRSDPSSVEILSRLVSLVLRSVKSPAYEIVHPLLIQIPIAFARAESLTSLVQASIGIAIVQSDRQQPYATQLLQSILPQVAQILREHETCYPVCCQLLARAAVVCLPICQDVLIQCFANAMQSQTIYDTSLEGGLVPILDLLSIVNHGNISEALIQLAFALERKGRGDFEVGLGVIRILLRKGNPSLLKMHRSWLNFNIGQSTAFDRRTKLDLINYLLILKYLQQKSQFECLSAIFLNQLQNLSISDREPFTPMTSPALPSYENTKIQIETEMREFHPQPEYVHWVLRRNEQKLNANSNIVKKVYEDHLWKELCSTIS